ncbi:MAG: hypothetical protein SFU87_09465 [Chitinophagaceae bacterium]|nr:hypothetical protein [Chitinophagaceae bacterium]
MRTRRIFLSVLLASAILSCRKDNSPSEPPLPSGIWVPLSLDYTGDVTDIFLLKKDTVVVTSYMDFNTYPTKTIFFQSNNGGRKWLPWKSIRLDAGGIRGIFCLNANSIYAGGGEALYYSGDNAKSWDTLNPNSNGYIPLHFFNKSRGILYTSSATFLTTNGGVSFFRVHDRKFLKAQFFNNSVGYACTNINLLKTNDGGNTWSVFGPIWKDHELISTIHFITENTGYMVVDLYMNGIAGFIRRGCDLYKTTDAGNTWIKVNDKIDENFNIVPYSCYFLNEQVGFLAGRYKILKTNDGGVTWSEDYVDSTFRSINKMVFTEAGIGYAIGTDGLILKRNK